MVEDIVTGIIINFLTDAVYLGYNMAKQLKRKNRKCQDEIYERMTSFFSTYEDTLINSSTFAGYLKLPQVSDTINNYICFIAAGKYAKGKKTFTKEDDVVRYLAENALALYDGQLSIPGKKEIETFFTDFFDAAKDFYFSRLNIRDKSVIFFINQKIDSLDRRLRDSMSEKVQNCCPDFADILERYYSIIKKKNQSLFVYGFRELKLEDFYVVPRLMKAEETNAKYAEEVSLAGCSKSDCTYTDLFRTDNIAYVIGGPGYGKSVLLKNIIVNYKKMQLRNEKDHLIIYCDLKNFYKNPQGGAPSVNDFLIDSIVEESGMSRREITEDFINYYLNVGRVIILLDALDEVPGQYRESLHKKITSYFLTCNPNNKVCITSRDRGFYPQNEIEVFKIMPLNRDQISKYLDNMVRLHYFDASGKDAFLSQADALTRSGFLNSFLILSLLVNIFKSERELPQTKLELYSKCFSYISRDREKAKSGADGKYNWTDIMKLMKDNTFIELAKLACPNNTDIPEGKILDHLGAHYRRKFGGTDRAETAVMQFLEFCSERTELFVPGQKEETYRFFHRSFFEYFYSRYIARLKTPKAIVKEFGKFDVDSEVFELTAAILKNEDELLYQQLIEYILKETEKGLKAGYPEADILNLLVLVMQAADDEEYIREFCRLLLEADISPDPENPLRFCTFSSYLCTSDTVNQLLNRYAASDPDLSRKFFEKYREPVFYDAINVLYATTRGLKINILEKNIHHTILRIRLRFIVPSIVFRSPGWNSYFEDSVRNQVGFRPLPVPDDSADAYFVNYLQNCHNECIRLLSRLSDEELAALTDSIFTGV